MGENQNDFREDQRKKGQSSPTLDRYTNQKISTLSKRIERDQWRT